MNVNYSQIPTYKLVYFPVRGRAEFIRYMFALAEVPYEEELVQFQDWPNRKPDVPFTTLPLLDINYSEHQINQSLAIGRFLAKRFGIAGRNVFEQALADAYVEGWQDIMTEYIKVAVHVRLGNVESAIQDAYKEFKEHTLNNYLNRFEKFLNSNPTHSGWFVGDGITWADLVIGEFIDRIRHVYDPNVLERHPYLDRFLYRLNSLPPIKRRIESRPDWKL